LPEAKYEALDLWSATLTLPADYGGLARQPDMIAKATGYSS